MNKKERIALTTLELIATKGFHGTSMSLIAKSSNIAIGTLYHYYKNKFEILETIYKMILKDFGVVLKQNLTEQKHPYDIFSNYWLSLYYYYTSNPYVFYFYEKINKPRFLPDSLYLESKKFYSEHIKIIEIGKKRKLIKNLPTDLLIKLFHNTVTATVELKLNNILTFSTKDLHDIIEAAWDCLCVKPSV